MQTLMQTILVPIDFTEASAHALLYANKLAERLPAEIVLVHGGAGPACPPQARAALLGRLEALAERLRYQELTRQGGRRIRYHYHVAAGALPEDLDGLVAGYRADLVVTGLPPGPDYPAADALARLPELVGCPVLVVPPGRQELPGRVVVSGDFAHCATRRLDWLARLTCPLHATYDLVQLHPPTSAGLATLKKALLDAHAHLPSATVHLLPEEDAVGGTLGFCAYHAARLLVLPTADSGLLHRFFRIYHEAGPEEAGPDAATAHKPGVPLLLLPGHSLPAAPYCPQQGPFEEVETGVLAYR